MKKFGIILLTIVMSVALVAGGALAKGGGGGGSGGSGGNSGGGGKADSGSVKGASDKTKGGQGEKSGGQDKKINKAMKKTVQKKAPVKFKDAGSHWAKNAMEKAQAFGLINGYEDSTFKPDAPVSEVEAMVMAVNLSDIMTEEEPAEGEDDTTSEDENSTEDGTVTEDQVSDVPVWAKGKAMKAAGLKIINVNRFHSAVQATRAQAAVMLAKALGLTPATEGSFVDVGNMTAEDLGYILALKNAGIVKGTPDGKFNPNSSVTRAEMAAMLSAIVTVVEEEQTVGTGETVTDGTVTEGEAPAEEPAAETPAEETPAEDPAI